LIEGGGKGKKKGLVCSPGGEGRGKERGGVALSGKGRLFLFFSWCNLRLGGGGERRQRGSWVYNFSPLLKVICSMVQRKERIITFLFGGLYIPVGRGR